MRFRPLRLTDSQYFQNNSFPYINYYGSELCFANLFAWKDIDKIEILITKHFILLKGIYGDGICFLPPIMLHNHPLIESIEYMEKYCQNEQIPFVLNGLNQFLKNEVLSIVKFPHMLIEQPNLFEYLYFPEDFFHYSGKKLHSKRNHLNKFIKTYSYSFRSYEPKDYPSILQLLDLWDQENGAPTLENQAIKSVLRHLIILDTFCDVIEVDNKIVAFSIGTISHNNTGIILFEKADTLYDGIYAAINSFVALKRYHNCIYINRQEDMGIDVLKKSKLSYRPVTYEYKYTITKDDIYYQTKREIRDLYTSSFDDSPYYMNYFFSEKYHFNNLWTKKLDNQVVAALHIVEKKLWYHSMSIKYPYVVAASTRLEYRHQGHMRTLIRNLFHALYLNKELIVGLNPVDKHFYQQFGFVFCTFAQPYTITEVQSNHNLKFVKIDMSQFDKLKQVYDKYAQLFDTYIIRDRTYWSNYMREVVFDHGYFELIYHKNQLVGYLVYVNNQIDEICLLSLDILPYLDKYHNHTMLIPTSNLDYPHNMIRIIHLKQFILSYPYQSSATDIISIEITDAFIEDNNMKIAIELKNGIVSITDVDVVQISITIEDFTSLLFTTHTPSHLKRLRTIFNSSYNLIYDKF